MCMYKCTNKHARIDEVFCPDPEEHFGFRGPSILILENYVFRFLTTTEIITTRKSDTAFALVSKSHPIRGDSGGDESVDFAVHKRNAGKKRL